MPTLTSKDNKLIKTAVKLKKSAKFRKKTGLFVAEGVRICVDAMLSGVVIDTLFVTKAAAEKNAAEYEKLSQYSKNTFTVTPELFGYISDTQSPQGFLGLIKTLDKSCQFDTIKVNGKFIALDNMQDPNNMGTVLRSCEAFGVTGVIMSADCCDVFSPKVVRGSMGAVFRLPFIICDTIADYLEAHPQLNSYAAVVDSDAEPLTEVKFDLPCVAVIGNEGNGLKPQTIDSCNHRITIPMGGKAESLNASAAAAVLIWEMIK